MFDDLGGVPDPAPTQAVAPVAAPKVAAPAANAAEKRAPATDAGRKPAVIPITTTQPAVGSAATDGPPKRFGKLRSMLAEREPDDENDVVEEHHLPLYPRLLRLRHIELNAWQRAVLVEGMVFVGVLGALADKATAWAPLVLPVAAAGVVKFHDTLTGLLPRGRDDAAEDEPAPAKGSALGKTGGKAGPSVPADTRAASAPAETRAAKAVTKATKAADATDAPDATETGARVPAAAGKR